MQVQALLLQKSTFLPLHSFAQLKKLYFIYFSLSISITSLKETAYLTRCSQRAVHALACPFFNCLSVTSYQLEKKQELKLLGQKASTFSFDFYTPGKKCGNTFLHYWIASYKGHRSWSCHREKFCREWSIICNHDTIKNANPQPTSHSVLLLPL